MEIPTSDTPVVAYTSSSNGNKLFSKKNILIMLFLLVVVVALPVGVYLVQKTQIFKSKADVKGASNFIQLMEQSSANCTDSAKGEDCTTSKTQVTLKLLPPGDDIFPADPSAPAAAPTPTPTTAPAAAPTPTPTTAPVSSAKPAVTASATSSCSKEGAAFKLSTQWQAVDNADSYKLYVKSTGPTSTYIIKRPDFGYTVSDLPAGTYLWQVRACNGENCGDLKDGQPTECK